MLNYLFFNHSPADEHYGTFQFPLLMTNVAVDILVPTAPTFVTFLLKLFELIVNLH